MALRLIEVRYDRSGGVSDYRGNLRSRRARSSAGADGGAGTRRRHPHSRRPLRISVVGCQFQLSVVSCLERLLITDNDNCPSVYFDLTAITSISTSAPAAASAAT